MFRLMSKRLSTLTVLTVLFSLAGTLGVSANAVQDAGVCAVGVQATGDKDKNGKDGKNKDWRYKRCETGTSKDAPKPVDDEKTPSSGGAGGGDGDWLTPGSKQYETAKSVFDFLTKQKGLSGASAAALVGEILPEAGFIPDRAEDPSGFTGVYSGECVESADPNVRRFGMNGKKPVCGMAYYPSKGVVGGGGIFQFTPFTKFTESSSFGKYGEGWAIVNQMDWFLNNVLANRELENGCYTWGGSAPDYTGTFTVESWMSMSDPAKAGDILYTCFLKGSVYQPERMENARQANAVFNKADVKADKSKWVKIGGPGGSANGGDGGTLDAQNVSPKETVSTGKCAVECPDGEAKDTSEVSKSPNVDGGGTSTGEDNAWHTYAELPAEIKKDAIDFSKFGLKPGQCEAGPWTKLGIPYLGQCVAWSLVALNVMWSKNGVPLGTAGGNGGDLAASYASRYGGSVSDTPRTGSVGSSIGKFCDTCSPVGHTMIALKPYSDGRVLVAEQNNSMAGDVAGSQCDWRYKIYPAETVKRIRWWYPGDAGYTLSLDGRGSAYRDAKDPFASLSNITNKLNGQCVDKANSNGVSGAGGDGGKALALAIKQIGKPYVWGAAGPDGFDCSGLVMWSFKNSGSPYSCGRDAGEQFRCVKAAGNLKQNITDCKAGDLVFWGEPGDYSTRHVAFLANDSGTEIVHASTPETGVIRGPFYSTGFKGCGAVPGN